MTKFHRRKPRHHTSPPPANVTPAPPKLYVGSHVWADFGDGYVLAHLEDDGHKNDAGETKYAVQNPETGLAEDLTYREPDDIDSAGTGRTFKTL
jgi:hypothetical protein